MSERDDDGLEPIKTGPLLQRALATRHELVTAGLEPGPWGFPRVAGACAVIGCSNPCAADDLLSGAAGV